MRDVAIVGAGASGLLCAIVCAQSGLSVRVFEQNTRCGKKILASGNGRCNISNTTFSPQDYFTQNYSFLEYALNEFDFKKFEKFVNSMGLILDKKEDGRVYPLSNEAKSVVHIFESYAKNLGVEFIYEHKVQDLEALFLEYKNVVVATGSNAASHLGGGEDGYEFAKFYNHTIVPLYPSLVQFELEEVSVCKKLSGLKLDASVTLFINAQKEQTIQGDLLFSSYGVSGFAILDISQQASEALLNYSYITISCNLLPQWTMQQLSNHIIKLSKIMPQSDILTALSGLLPLKLLKVMLDELDISQQTPLSAINQKIAKKIASKVTSWKFTLKDTHGFRHAEVSGGGVDTTEVNATTMESYKRKNLYFCGEVLDVVGKRGGYNFAWAWASGYVAGKNIIKKS